MGVPMVRIQNCQSSAKNLPRWWQAQSVVEMRQVIVKQCVGQVLEIKAGWLWIIPKQLIVAKRRASASARRSSWRTQRLTALVI
jgi:hypothetical protein